MNWAASRAALVVGLVGLFPGGTRHQAGRPLSCVTKFRTPASVPITSVDRIIPLNGGGLVVLDGERRQLYRFAAGGDFIRAFGRPGAGPGEFQTPTNAGLVGNQIWVADQGQQRFTLFDPDGRVIRTLPLLRVMSVIGRVPYTLRALLSENLALLIENGTYDVAEELRARGRRVLSGRVNPTGLDTLAILDYRDGWLVVPLAHGTSLIGMDQPWASNDLLEVSPDGSYVLRLSQSAGDRSRGKVQFHWLRVPEPGAPRLVDFSVAVAPLSERTVADWIKRLLRPDVVERFGSAAAAERGVRQHMVRPINEPAVRMALVGNDGAVWLGRGTDGRHWEVFDANAGFRAAFEISRTVTLLAVSFEEAWGFELDANDVPVVCRYRASNR